MRVTLGKHQREALLMLQHGQPAPTTGKHDRGMRGALTRLVSLGLVARSDAGYVLTDEGRRYPVELLVLRSPLTPVYRLAIGMAHEAGPISQIRAIRAVPSHLSPGDAYAHHADMVRRGWLVEIPPKPRFVATYALTDAGRAYLRRVRAAVNMPEPKVLP